MDTTHLDMILIDDDMACLFDGAPPSSMHPAIDDDIDIFNDLPLFKSEVYDFNDATTDDSSTGVSSPSASECSDTSTTTTSPMNSYPIATAYPWMPAVVPTALSLPFAMPIGVPTVKRSLDSDSSSSEPHVSSKRSKHEIRLMKNRESANKSRMRRKNQVSDLATENSDLKAQLAERDAQLAARDATIKSLTEQLHFLRSLVATSSSPSSSVEAAPSTVGFNKTTLAAPAAGIVLCAFVFGLTLFSDPYAHAPPAASHRRSMRVVHGMSAAAPSSPSSTMFMSTTPTSFLGELGVFFDSLWLHFVAVFAVGLLCVVVLRQPIQPSQATNDIRVSVNLHEKKGTVVHRMCHRASRWVTRSSATTVGKMH